MMSYEEALLWIGKEVIIKDVSYYTRTYPDFSIKVNDKLVVSVVTNAGSSLLFKINKWNFYEHELDFRNFPNNYTGKLVGGNV